MKLKRESVVVLGICFLVVTIMAVTGLFWLRGLSQGEMDQGPQGNRLENGFYSDYSIWCEKTDETVKEVRVSLPFFESSIDWIVYRCTASPPGDSTNYVLDIDIAQGSTVFIYWSACNKVGKQLSGNITIDDTEYDIVHEDSLHCVSPEPI